MQDIIETKFMSLGMKKSITNGVNGKVLTITHYYLIWTSVKSLSGEVGCIGYNVVCCSSVSEPHFSNLWRIISCCHSCKFGGRNFALMGKVHPLITINSQITQFSTHLALRPCRLCPGRKLLLWRRLMRMRYGEWVVEPATTSASSLIVSSTSSSIEANKVSLAISTTKLAIISTILTLLLVVRGKHCHCCVDLWGFSHKVLLSL